MRAETKREFGGLTDAVLMLRLEHGNIGQVLTLLEAESVELVRGGAANLELLQSIVAYISQYPDTCHHPKEDLLLRKLRARDPAAAAGVDGLEQEHADLMRLTGRLEAAVAAVAHEPAQHALDALAETLELFAGRYRAHMTMEEERFFPVALARLTSSDWAELDYDLFDREDPLFDTSCETRFKGLRQRIARLAARPPRG